MFSLIITIISIALVAALALATLYYGGSAFNRGSEGAAAARLINEGQQINGAVAIMRADSASTGAAVATDLLGLQTGLYLAQVPAGWTADAGMTVATSGDVSDKVCIEVEKRAGVADFDTEDAAATLADGRVYGCVTGSGAGSFAVAYRL